MSLFKKQIIINIYSPSGVFLSTLPNFTFEGFSKELNGGLSECVLTTDKIFDYSGTDIILGNDVEIRIIDKDTVTALATEGSNSIIIYRGYISMIEREANGQQESVVIRLLGYYTLLSLDILKNSTQTTLYSDTTNGLTTSSSTAADIGLMVRAVINRYIAETVSPKLSYDVDDIPLTSTTANYVFEQKTYRESLDILRSMAPAGIFYYINEIGKVTFKTKPTIPTHKFIFGKHFNKVHVEHSLEKVRNFALIWNGKQAGDSIYKHYEDIDSVAIYGRRVQVDNDYGITNSNAMDLLGARFIVDNKLPDVKVTCKIIDNNLDENMGYDIESIQPGDTCSFYGFSTGFDDIFQDNMLITAVNYTMDSVEIVVEIIKSSLLELQRKQETAIKDISTGGLVVATTYS